FEVVGIRFKVDGRGQYAVVLAALGARVGVCCSRAAKTRVWCQLGSHQRNAELIVRSNKDEAMSGSPPRKLSRRAVLKFGAAIGALPLAKVSRGFAQETIGNFPAGVSGPSVFIGLTVPLTGPYSAEGDDMQRGYKLGIRHLNNGGGIVSKISTLSGNGVLGKRIEYKIADTQTQPDPAVQAATNFITNNRAIMISGSVSSAEAIALEKVA